MEENPEVKAIADTHVLIWYLEGADRLGTAAIEILENRRSKIIVPAIVLAELLFYLRKKKCSQQFPVCLQRIKNDSRMSVAPLTETAVSLIPEGLEMHDGIIAATWLLERDAVILSRDAELRGWNRLALVWD